MVILGAAAMPALLDVVALGETMVLFLAQQAGPLREATTFSRHIAGAESNVAVGLCRLGRSAGFVSRLGDDEFGRVILMRLRGEGVDVSQVTMDASAPTGWPAIATAPRPAFAMDTPALGSPPRRNAQWWAGRDRNASRRS